MKTFIDFCQLDGKELLIPIDKIGAIFKTENGLTTIVVGDQKYAVAESMDDMRNTLKSLQCTIMESIISDE